jgi:betaine-aldehyde dehydrogenase
MTRTLTNFINGESVDAAEGRTSELVDPSTGDVFATAPVSGDADIDAAFQSAERAFETWRDITPSDRQRALLRIADAIEDRAAELVDVECQNTGKPRELTTSEEISPMCDQIRFFAGAARVLEGKSARRVHDRLRFVHPARADRRLRRRDALELPGDDGGLEVGPGARGR